MSLLKDKIELDVELAELRAKETMSRFPPLLRWLLVICVLAIIPAYYISKSVSYNYWTKAYSGLLITAKKSFTDAKPPRIGNAIITSAGSGNYGAAIEVFNDNLDLSLPTANYQITFLDQSGAKVYQETGTTFLLPNDDKFLVAPRFTSTTGVKSVNFAWTSELNWEKRQSIPKVNIQVASPDAYNQFLPPAYIVEGSYLNNSPYQLAQVRLTFLVYDRLGRIVATSRRDDFTVQPGERRAYLQTWPNLYGDPSFTVKVLAETNTLDPKNLTLPPAPTTPASDLSH